MTKAIILGASAAVPTRESANTHMLFPGRERTVLVDAPGGSTVLRLEQAGVDFNTLSDVIVTHFHIDHSLGIPSLLVEMWLLGRRRPLHIYGLAPVLERLQTLLGLYDWQAWPNLFPVVFQCLPAAEMAPVLECADFRIQASPVHHGIPNIGLRVEFKPGGQTLAYSCDTAPCQEVVRLGAGADVLIHEATGEMPGHSSARQAGEIARQAQAGSLYLIHYPAGEQARHDLVADAQTTFPGKVALAKDFMTID
ncbi:MAG: MBL fold metallo-hydrolase [Chloroflexota bacterium]